jgi:FdhE protein
VQRVLDPTQIEGFADREIPRLRLPARAQLFADRAQRLRSLGGSAQVGQGGAIGDYLQLMAVIAEAQHAAVSDLRITGPSAEELQRARVHGMPLIHAVGFERDPCWRGILGSICASVLAASELPRALPAAVHATCTRLQGVPAAMLEEQADAVLALRADEIDPAAAPFIMSALQVLWLELASRFSSAEVPQLSVPGVCPLCGTLPVASVVRIDRGSAGYRYLHCALCATEWHMVRVTCSQCQATKDLGYYSIEGGSEAVRAEACPQCRSYRKILYQEKDMRVEPVADDLASVALDLLMSAEGYRRASGNPLLWFPVAPA